ncbi:MAG: dienelactone hydrolase family protein [Nitrososphaeraceae archaeon]
MKFFRTTIVFPIIGLSIVAGLIIVMVGSQQDQAREVFAQPNNDSSETIDTQNQTISYFDNASGYLVSPVADISNNETGQLPAVVMIHEWWGLNENIKNMANELAEQGYVVLAADMFNGQVATTPDQAMQFSGAVRENPSEAISNLQAAVRYLGSLENVNASRIGSLGWCFGGGQSLQLALNTEAEHPLAATVIYYGNLVTDQEELTKIQWPVLGIFGDQDESIPVEDVDRFGQALNSTGVPNEIYIYEGVGHAFANPSGDNYAAEQTGDAWQKTLDFLKRNL